MSLPPDPMYEVRVRRGADRPYVLYNRFTGSDVLDYPSKPEAEAQAKALNDKMRATFRGGKADGNQL